MTLGAYDGLYLFTRKQDPTDPLAPVQAPPFHGAHPKQKFAYAEADTGERLMLAVAILD